jgi:general secretion pathway protein K
VRTRLRPNRSGIALIIVLIVIVVLGMLAIGFGSAMKVETTLARHASFNSELDWLGRSGVEVAKWILSVESTGKAATTDSLKSYWAGGPGETNGPLPELTWPMKIGNGEISRPKIIDLDRKLNINRADERILEQALTLIGVDAGAMTTIVNSILDWRDPDSNPRISGTESEVYEQQDPPYMAKNGPIDDLSELLLIRGVSPAMYWGAGGGGLPPIFNRPQAGLKSKFEEPTYAVGMVDLFTPLSAGGINVNTASATVLQLIPWLDANTVPLVIQERAGLDGQDGTDDDTPFPSVPAFLARLSAVAPVPPEASQQFGGLFAVKSQIFQVEVTATIGGSKRDYVAILRRVGPKDSVVLNLYWK